MQESRTVLPDLTKKSFSYETATRFGELSVLIPSKREADQLGKSELELLEAGLAEFTDKDYLILTGDPILCSLAFFVAAMKLDEDQDIKVLKFNRGRHRYEPSIINLPA